MIDTVDTTFGTYLILKASGLVSGASRIMVLLN